MSGDAGGARAPRGMGLVLVGVQSTEDVLAWDNPHSLGRNVAILPFGTLPTWAEQGVDVGIVELCPLSPLHVGALGLAVMLKACCGVLAPFFLLSPAHSHHFPAS